MVNALYLGSFIVAKTKPWIARARSYLAEAEVRRQREEEQRRQEMESRLKEEEEQLRLEAEKRRQEEEELHRVEEQQREEQRRVEEEERRLAEEERRREEEGAAEKRRQEEEADRARLEEERLAVLEREKVEREQKAEEQRLEQERMHEEQRKKYEVELDAMREENKKQLEEEREAEKRRIAEELAEEMRIQKEQLEQAKQQAAAEREEQERQFELEMQARQKNMQMEQERLDRERQEVARDQENVKQARLSISQLSGSDFRSTNDDEDRSVTEVASLRHAAEDADTDIGDSVSVANGGRAVVPDPMVEALVREQTRIQVAQLMQQKQEMEARNREEVRLLLERNAALEAKCKAQETEEPEVHSPLRLSPPRNATPSKELQCGPSPLNLSPIASTPGSAAQGKSNSKQKSRSSRLLGSPSQPERRYSILSECRSGKKRLSVAHEAFNATPIAPLSQAPSEAGPSQGDDGSQFDASCTNAHKNRKWWAEQRNFLMQDLYMSPPGSNHGATPTPSRADRGRRLTQVPGQDPQSVVASDSARVLAKEFDEPDVAHVPEVPAEEDAGNIEWVADCTMNTEAAKKQTKMRQPKVHRKGGN